MIALIIVAGGLYSLAKKRNMNAIVWAIIGVAAWFGGQFIGGLILGLADPGSVYDDGALLAYGLGGAIGASIFAFVMLEVIYRNKQKSLPESDEVMDDVTVDEL
ncbi:MAG: hypothetical protein HUJ25_10515 [Crocinitomicaceae bacterium]|nr:hypothetical protein [Crocinitomicaceae bacterium]